MLFSSPTVFAEEASSAPQALPQLSAYTVGSDGIRPSLDPVSHDRFMGHDLPKDGRPAVNRWHKRYDFDPPYPIVQEDAKYDVDFVKDENNDSGEWRAQERYDRLRIDIAKAKAEVDRRKAELQQAEGALQRARAAEKNAESASKDAETKADGAENSATEAQDRADGAAGQASEKVDSELSDLEKCKEELAKAKKLLEEMLRREKEAEGKFQELADDSQQKAKIAEESRRNEGSAQSKLQREKADYDQATKEYQKALQDVKETEAALSEAAARLRRFRRHVDDEGGVYYVPGPDGKRSEGEAKSFGSGLAPRWPLAAAALVAMTLLM